MTAVALRGAARDLRGSWNVRASVAVAVLVLAALAPLVLDEPRVADLAGGLYLALAAVGLGLVVGIAGLPLLAQGAFMAIGATVAAHLLAHGVPTVAAAVVGGLAAGSAGLGTGLAFVRLPRAAFAAATWVVAWAVAAAAGSLGWVLGGSQGLVVSGGPSPRGHYELALALTALAVAGVAAARRSPFGLCLAAAREREAAAAALGVPYAGLRARAVAAAAGVAGVAGALAVQLAGVADPASYGPYLSFKLFVFVLVGGALAPAGGLAGAAIVGALSVAADTVGSLENVSASRAHELLAAIMLLGVVSLGWEGLLRPGRSARRAQGEPPARPPARQLAATGLTKRFGALVAVDDVSLELLPRTITALIGPNGSGKTTVLRLLAGRVEPDGGMLDADVPTARTLQSTAVFPSLSPLEHVLVGSSRRRGFGGPVRAVLATPKYRAEDAAFVAEAQQILARFDLPSDTTAGVLAAGDQRALMLAASYATGAPVLLVDEPTAGASLPEARRVTDLLSSLREEGLSVLVVEHNLGVVRTVADRVIVLDAGRVIADGAPDDVARDDRVRAAYLGRQAL